MTRRRVALIALAAAGTAALGGGCAGGDDGDSKASPVVWASGPRLLRPSTADRALIVQGTIRNAGSRRVEIRADQVELRERGGNRVNGTAAFLSGYVRPGESQNRGPANLSSQEERRLGKVAIIDPGQTAPLVVSWRTREGRPARIRYPGGSLDLPAR